MRCEHCKGRGMVKKPHYTIFAKSPIVTHIMVPCAECNGSGIAHCCDGICIQPGEVEQVDDQLSE